MVRRIWDFIRSQRGNVESALVLIPLLTIFLIGTEISYAIHMRNVERGAAQNGASVRAISGEFSSGDEFIHIESSGDGQNLDLLVAHREKNLSNLLPSLIGFASPSSIDVSGIAIVENQR
jgi:hypothetical protein